MKILSLILLLATGGSVCAQTHSYDAAGRLIWSTQASGAATAFGYDANGNLETVTNILPGQDSDGDGVPDSFEVFYTGSATALSATADEDGDGDGAKNLVEFAFAREPRKPDAQALTPVSIEPPSGSSRFVTLRYLRPKQGPSVLSYQAEVAYALAPNVWSAAAADVEQLSVVDQGGGVELVTVRAKAAVNSVGALFVRVRVTKL